jgi:hypothetical protein
LDFFGEETEAMYAGNTPVFIFTGWNFKRLSGAKENISFETLGILESSMNELSVS